MQLAAPCHNRRQREDKGLEQGESTKHGERLVEGSRDEGFGLRENRGFRSPPSKVLHQGYSGGL